MRGQKENMGMILWTDVTNRKLDTKLEEDALLSSVRRVKSVLSV